MGRHIKSYSEVVNESISKGSVILIKGKSEKGKKKLYVTHITGSVSLQNGAVMLFLSDEFYRIKEEEGRLKAVKISYRSEEELKSALNLKSPGKISIVKNENKTPFHWKTLKHTSIQAALKEIEGEIMPGTYLFESVSKDDDTDQAWREFIDLVFERTANTVFFGKNEIDIIRYRIDDIYQEIWDSEKSNLEVEWELELTVLLKGAIFKQYMEKLNLTTKTTRVIFYFKSDLGLDLKYDPGDYWTPSYSDVEIDSVETYLEATLVDGSSPESAKSQELEKEINKIVSSKEMLPDELEKFISPNLSSQTFIRREK